MGESCTSRTDADCCCTGGSAESSSEAKVGMLLERGNQACSNGDPQLAVQLYTEALMLNPTSVKALTNRSTAYYLLGDFCRSLEDAEVALNTDSSRVKAHYRKALALQQMDRAFEALQAVNEALLLQPRAGQLVKLHDNVTKVLRSDFRYSRHPEIHLSKNWWEAHMEARVAEEGARLASAKARESQRARDKMRWDEQWDEERRRQAAGRSTDTAHGKPQSNPSVANESLMTSICRRPEEILGVDEAASHAEIKRAYRTKAFSAHPDKGGSDQEFAELQDAFRQLMGIR